MIKAKIQFLLFAFATALSLGTFPAQAGYLKWNKACGEALERMGLLKFQPSAELVKWAESGSTERRALPFLGTKELVVDLPSEPVTGVSIDSAGNQMLQAIREHFLQRDETGERYGSRAFLPLETGLFWSAVDHLRTNAVPIRIHEVKRVFGRRHLFIEILPHDHTKLGQFAAEAMDQTGTRTIFWPEMLRLFGAAFIQPVEMQSNNRAQRARAYILPARDHLAPNTIIVSIHGLLTLSPKNPEVHENHHRLTGYKLSHKEPYLFHGTSMGFAFGKPNLPDKLVPISKVYTGMMSYDENDARFVQLREVGPELAQEIQEKGLEDPIVQLRLKSWRTGLDVTVFLSERTIEIADEVERTIKEQNNMITFFIKNGIEWAEIKMMFTLKTGQKAVLIQRVPIISQTQLSTREEKLTFLVDHFSQMKSELDRRLPWVRSIRDEYDQRILPEISGTNGPSILVGFLKRVGAEASNVPTDAPR